MSPVASLALGILLVLLQTEYAGSTSCSFYCFVTPSRKETFDVASYNNLSCTHFVYGFTRTRSDLSLRSVTSRDNLEVMNPGNLRKFLGLRNSHPEATLLLGVELTPKNVFHDVRHARRVAERIGLSARKRHFDGVFIRMHGPALESSITQHFLSALSLTYSSTSSETTLSVTPRWLWTSGSRLHEFVDHVEHVYLDMEELPSAEDEFSVSHLDPLMPSDSIPFEDTISGSTEKLLSSGVPSEKIIIGLSSGGKTYRVRRPKSTVHGDMAMQPAIRRPLQDLCHSTRTFVDEKSGNTVIEGRFNWTSANFPKLSSLGKKIEWIMQEGLGGIGISSLQFDDPKGKCGAGSYPSHTMIGQMLKCRTKEFVRRPSVQCTRLCYLDETAEEFDPWSLQTHWCSHMVIGPADIQLTDMVELTPAAEQLITNVEQWWHGTEHKPAKIILSIGARQTSDIWRMELGSIIKRKHLINNIKRLAVAKNAVGVEISWTLGVLDSTIDPSLLTRFLTELRLVLPKDINVYLTVNPMSSFAGRYDVKAIQNVTDFIILQTHRLHSQRQPIAGHHSAMFAGDGMQDGRMTVEVFVKDWISRGVPREKIVVSLSAAPTTTTMMQEWDGTGELFGRPINLTPFLEPSEITSQTEICQTLQDNSTDAVLHWMDTSSVPVIVHGLQLVTFDNERSAKIKATWSSLNNLGGMAIHGLPFDNPNGECPDRPFPILQSIVDTQVCALCAAEEEKESTCPHGFQTVCNYRLPEPDEAESLSPATIPFERCSEVVVEHAIIDINASIHFVSKEQEEVAKQLKNYHSRAKRVVVSLRCSMDVEDFAHLMHSSAKRMKLAASIRSFADNFSFNGVELRCADVVTKATKIQFAHFLRVLNKEMKKNPSEKCGNTVSLRLSAWHSDLRSVYDVMALNSLHHVVLEPFTVPLLPETAFANSPLFPVVNQSLTSIDVIVQRWERSGLIRSKILLQIPSYGMEQLLVNRTDVGIGRPTEREYAIIGQAELCQRLKYAGTVRKTHWDSMSVNAWTTGGRWISIDDQQTVKYKMRYALREGLAGVGLLSLNEDDHQGTCGSGAFPILRSISAKCH
ncbi:hypothetical protein Q1695_006127 [Nippostrongylus brasiliensis]|nr:hypothetical protein Q1695_006127 [Nippostrongylus brasiliensis]